MTTRSVNQIEADQVDAILYRLIGRAEARALFLGPGADGRKWMLVRALLLQARPIISDMMHPDDKAPS
jgi:hypothetical protein